jgi:methionyl-tRNA formyltransferase
MVTRAFRVVFFGTPAFAVPTLETLLESAHTVTAVITQPDRPSGRGHRTADSPVKARAAAAGIPVLQPRVLKDPGFVDSLAALRADIGVVAAYGRILPEAVLALPAHGLINVHASLLPRYRGAAPVHRAVMAGEHETGVTIMRIVPALDAGPMLAAERRPIGPDETSEMVERDLAHRGASLLRATLDRLVHGPIEERAQDEREATYAPRLTRDDGIVDWWRSAGDVHNQIRGLYPWPHAHTFLDGRRLILLRSTASTNYSPAAPGSVVTAQGDDLSVATASGTLRIVELQTEGKRPVTAREFMAGHRVEPGSRFSTAP